METKRAIAAFSQSEKVKSGILWVNQAVEIYNALPAAQQRGAVQVIRAYIDMIVGEVSLARRITGDASWVDTERNLDMARVMIDSGVVQEASYHLIRALTHVTSIGQRSMSELDRRGLI